MESYDRRKFLATAAVGATALGTGCLHSGGSDDPSSPSPSGAPDVAGFGYDTWTPVGDYATLGYLDVAAIGSRTDLGDARRSVVPGVALPLSDIDARLSASGSFALGGPTPTSSHGGTGTVDSFEAFAADIDAGALADSVASVLTGVDRTRRAGFEVLTGSVPPDAGGGNSTGGGSDITGEAEVAVADGYAVAGDPGEPTAVVDTATGDAPPHADENELLAGVSDYTVSDSPVGVLIDFGFSNVAYRILEERDGSMVFVEVVLLDTEEEARNVYDNYSLGGNVSGINVTRDDTNVVIASEVGDLGQMLGVFP